MPFAGARARVPVRWEEGQYAGAGSGMSGAGAWCGGDDTRWVVGWVVVVVLVVVVVAVVLWGWPPRLATAPRPTEPSQEAPTGGPRGSCDRISGSRGSDPDMDAASRDPVSEPRRRSRSDSPDSGRGRPVVTTSSSSSSISTSTRSRSGSGSGSWSSRGGRGASLSLSDELLVMAAAVFAAFVLRRSSPDVVVAAAAADDDDDNDGREERTRDSDPGRVGDDVNPDHLPSTTPPPMTPLLLFSPPGAPVRPLVDVTSASSSFPN